MASQIQREKEFKVSPNSLYRVIIDFENYKNFLPEVVGSQIVSGKGTDKVRVRFEIEVMKRFVYDLEFRLFPEKEVHWKLMESDFFKANQGKWILTPNASGTLVKYELEVGFGFLVPGWITKKLTESNLPQMFDKFETRAKEIQSHD
ncbi:MAG: type II toxin-antitoxin system RatA family toxin [Pseudomonadota bacterium]